MATLDTPLHFPEPHEIEGYWGWDKIHAPRPVTPLAGDAVIMGLGEGFTIAQHEFGSPLALRVRIINNYVYGMFEQDQAFTPPTRDPDEYARELERHAFGVGERWVDEWEPALRRSMDKLRAADFASMSDRELLDALDERLRELLYAWTIHGWINLSLIPATALTDFYNQEIGPDDPNEAWQLTQGYENKSVDASSGLWRLAQSVKASPTLLKIVEEREPREMLTDSRVVRGGPSVSGRPAPLPGRVRLAQRRHLRNRRPHLARGAVDPTQHDPGLFAPERRQQPGGGAGARTAAARGVDRHGARQTRERPAEAGALYRVDGRSQVQPAPDRGPQLLD